MAQTVEELAEILDNMKLEADRNAETFDKLLQSINNKIEFMSTDTEADDLIKVYLTELKKTLEERHALVVEEFGKMETSFKSLTDEQSQLIKTSQAKEMFDTFSDNMKTIAQELYNQKELLAQYNERFAAFSADKSDKNEIITSVAAIRKDVEIINENFESSISDINSNIQSIFKNLIVMDPTAQNDIVKRELENVYLSANAILSSLHVVDQKNDDLAQTLEKISTKEDIEKAVEKLDSIATKSNEIFDKFSSLAEKSDIDSIMSKTSEISDKMNVLPLREDLRYFAEKTNELSAQISSLPQKDDLQNITHNTVENLQAKLDELSVKSELDGIIKKAEEITEKFSPVAEKSDIENVLVKSVEISEKLDSAATKQDIDPVFEQAKALETQIASLPQQSDLAGVYQTVHEFSDIIENLRTTFHSANEDTNRMINEHLDRLNSTLSDVVTEKDFTGFRHDLADFIQKIIDNSASLNENLNINKEVLEKLITEVENLDIHQNIETIANALEGLQAGFARDTEKITGDINSINEKINSLTNQPLEEKITNLNVSLFDAAESLKNMQSEVFEKLSQDNEEISKQIENLNIPANFGTLNNSMSDIREISLHGTEKISSDIENLSSKLDNLPVNNIELKIDNLNTELISNAGRLQNMHAGLTEQLSGNLREINDKIDGLNFENKFETIGSNMEILKNITAAGAEKIDNLNIQGEFETVNGNLENLKNISLTGLQKIDELNLQNRFENLNSNLENLKNISLSSAEKIDELNTAGKLDTINGSIESLKDASIANAERLSGEVENISSKLDTFTTLSFESRINDIKENLEETSQKLSGFQNDVMEKLSEDDSEKFSSLHNNIDFLRETITSAQTANETSLSEKLLALRDMITSSDEAGNEKLAELRNQIEEFTDKVRTISGDTGIKISEAVAEMSAMKTEVEKISKDFTEWNYGQETRDSKIVNMISSELGELGVAISTLQDSVQAGVHHELSKNSEVVEQQINSLIEHIDNLKDELNSKDEEEPFDFEEHFKEVREKITAVKQEINLINTDITDAVNSQSEAVQNAISNLQDSLNAFSNLEENLSAKFEETTLENTSKISEAIEEVKTLVNNAAETLNVKDVILTSAEDVKRAIINKITISDTSEVIKHTVTSSADDVKKTIGDKILQTGEDLKNLLSVAMNNDDITWAIDNLKSDLSDKVTRIFNERNNLVEILDKTNEISGHNTKISELLDTLNQKIDIIAMTDNDDDYEVLDEIDEVKNMISSQRQLLENTAGAEKVNAIENQLQELIDKIDTIENTDLKDMRESILSTILNVFEQISFIEESEDIKDFVEEKTEEINKNLIEVKQQLKQIANNDDGYSYTLQDVESDIAKLRLVINDISNSTSNEDIADISDNIHKIVTSVEDLQNSLTQEQIADLKSDFEKLSEDIVSISSRTNKLLLTSDESYNALNNGLNDFSNIVYKLEERINYLDNTEITERIEKKLDNVTNIVTGSANSDKVMRQALMYMGEWIDTASENIENINEQTEKIDNLQSNIDTICRQTNPIEEIHSIIKKLETQTPNQLELIKTLAERFDKQQERIDRLEMQLEKILSAVDDIDDTKLSKKVDKIDKQLAKLSGTIEKLASYVDE